MAENANLEKAPKLKWFEGVKAEFRKISWPTKDALVKQTTAVIAVSVAVGLFIALWDRVVQYGVDFLVKF